MPQRHSRFVQECLEVAEELFVEEFSSGLVLPCLELFDFRGQIFLGAAEKRGEQAGLLFLGLTFFASE